MPRTDPGEGSVYRRKDGRWIAVLRWEAPGQPVKLYECSGPTRAAALARRRAKRAELQAAQAEAAAGPWLTDWLTTWQAAQAARWAPGTRAAVARAVRCHIGPAFPTLRLAALTPERAEAWRADLLASGLSPNTIPRLWAILRAACTAAVRAGHLPSNPLARATPPPAAAPRTAALTPAQAAAVLAHVATYAPRWWPLLALAVYTGLRKGELLGLQWGAVDWTAGTLTVRASLSGYNRATWALRPPKTARSVRTLPLTPPMRAALTQARAWQEAAQATAGAAWAPFIPDLVFTTGTGNPITDRNALRAWQTYSARAGVPVLPLHSLRHTAATALLDAQIPLPVVLAWFGWASSAMLIRVYSHPSVAHLAQVGEALAARLSTGIPLESVEDTKKES